MLDSSATLAWVLEDERENALESLESLYSERAAVPQHWILEVTNGLRIAVRRQRLKPGELPVILERLRVLPLQVDAETSIRGWDETLALAERFGLTTYDAAYLELALRLEVPLATLDTDLAHAARAAKIRLFS